MAFRKFEPDEPREWPLGHGPDLVCAWVKDRTKRRFLGIVELEAGEDWTEGWRNLASENGPGQYEILAYLDEALETPAGLNYFFVAFVDEWSIEGWRLYPYGWSLGDEEIADLEAGLEGAIAVGNAAPAEMLVVTYERLGRWEDVERVADAGMRAPDHDHGIWRFYDQDKRSLRNVQRRLLEARNRASRKLRGPGGALYSTVDVGEADPSRSCEKCGKKGALPGGFSLGRSWVCHGCLPSSVRLPSGR